MVRLLLPPGQYLPARHNAHGLVPTKAPFPQYPWLHRHWFCRVEFTGELEFNGHVFCTPLAHQEFAGQLRQALAPIAVL